ncbi:hypothetical protein OSB04_022992 [Centaurea solstitialis]|uniref:Uncharacterized protein n=1 Tax=Centaurea solstitialis TaxID=347529 RepID=A0AA38SIB1_9ASTR|nr:hypothetical protein OSB04_022992 [Centaurea solstitialis]
MNRNSDSLIGNGGGRNNLHTNGFHNHNIQKSVLDDDDDLLSFSSSNQEEDGKHDYDWLLTPPGTPLLPSSDGNDSQPTSVAPRRNSSVRSGSTVKTSRVSFLLLVF